MSRMVPRPRSTCSAHHHGELTFSMVYAYSEKFMLVFSHDEVVHGKASMVGKMPGEREQKFANLRLTYAYMMTHPGKKLLFMGQDLGEFDEWNEGRQVEWELMEVPEHKGISNLVKDLNHLYRSNPELYAVDDAPEGFEWVNQISWEDCFLTFLRKGAGKDEVLLVAANFSGVEREITTGVPLDGKYKEIFNTDDGKYGGTGIVNSRVKRSKEAEWDDRPYSVTVKLAPLSLSILKYIPLTEEELAKEAMEKAGHGGCCGLRGSCKTGGGVPEGAGEEGCGEEACGSEGRKEIRGEDGGSEGRKEVRGEDGGSENREKEGR